MLLKIKTMKKIISILKRVKNYLKDLDSYLSIKFHSCNGNYVCIDEYQTKTVHLDKDGNVDNSFSVTSSSATFRCKICGHIEYVD